MTAKAGIVKGSKDGQEVLVSKTFQLAKLLNYSQIVPRPYIIGRGTLSFFPSCEGTNDQVVFHF